jgi:short-subunit dehydrogenase
MSKFQDKIVWVTGASAGIGSALVRAFAAQGAKLVLSARRRSELEKVAAETGLPQDQFMVLPLDLLEPDSFPQKVQEVKDRFGGIDLLVHNAGISQRSLAKETDLDVYRRLMEVNYFGTVALTQAVLPGMLEAGKGHFAVVSSLVGKFGTPMRSGYSASKHALHGYFDSLRAETWREGITVTIVCPGFIQTDVSINALTADGSPQKSMDDSTSNGMEPDKFARKMLKVIARQKEEVWIGGMEVRAVYLKRFFPAIFSKFIRKAKVT